MADLDAALQQFEAAESNLEKLETLWKQIEEQIGTGPAFGNPPNTMNYASHFAGFCPHYLPSMDFESRMSSWISTQ